MACLRRLGFEILLLLFFTVFVFGSVAEEAEEKFFEELLLKPLPDRKVLAHFHFQSRAPSRSSDSHGRHHHLFPKAISQLVKKFHVKEMELSFTQGRWKYDQWGGFDPLSSGNAKPPGVELWAVFDVPLDLVDSYWKNLTHSLSGLFCASINFLESSASYSAPDWGFPPASGSLRYGTLPREAVCTENLTPWLKLLPCWDKAGLSQLMDRPSIYGGFYHSQRLHLISNEYSSAGVSSGIVLDQTLTIVLQPNRQRSSLSNFRETKSQPSWSLSSIFGKKFSGRCSLAESSNVFLQLEKDLASKLSNLVKRDETSTLSRFTSEDFRSNPGFELSVKPDYVLEELNSMNDKSVLYMYSINNYSKFEQFDLDLTWNLPVIWTAPQSPLSATRFLMGSGNERGAIAISLKSTELSQRTLHAIMRNDKCELQVKVLQVFPWYIKVYFHTLQVFINEENQPVRDVVKKMHVSPSEDKVSPGMMEMIMSLPCDMKSAAATIEFDKGFLHIDEYPPDANQGFDIPSAVISFPDFHTSTRFVDCDSLNESPIISNLQKESPVLSYTEVLLVPLTTPDFSMPYNVITITCTVFALYFGSLLNVLRRRVGEEERFQKNKAGKRSFNLPLLLSKLYARLRGRAWEPPEPGPSSSTSSFLNLKLLLKVVLVAGVAALWQYYSA